MRIVSITNSPLDPALGSGKTVLAWSQGLRDLGYEVEVFAPGHYYQPWPGEKGKRLKMRVDARGLEKRLLQGGFDLVEFYGAEFGWLIDQLARVNRANRPLLVAHTNGLELLARKMDFDQKVRTQETKQKRWFTRWIEPWLCRCDEMAFSRVDAFAAICQADADYVIAHRIQPRERCVVVEPGIDESYRNALWNAPKKHRLVTLGSWASRKDPITITKVVSRLLDSDGELEFHVLGAGEAKARILSSFPEGLRSRVTVHPRLEESGMVKVLTTAKVFFFPSLYEGFGMATTEAMACGCAPVVTPTGFGASIRHGFDGFICNFGDVESMVQRVRELLGDENLCRRVATAGRRRVEELTWKNQVRKLEQTYRGWLESN